MKKYGSRKDVPEKYQWDLSFLYENDEEWEKVYKETDKLIPKIDSYVGKLDNVDTLLEYLELDLKIGCQVMDLYVYATTKLDEDLSNAKYQDMLGKADVLDNKYSIAISFFEPEILSIKDEEYQKIINDSKLSKYKVYLNKIYRYKNHVLSKEEEKIVSSLTSTVSSYSQLSTTMLNSCHEYGTITDSDGNKEEIMVTNYRKLMKSLPRDKRKQVYTKFNKTLSKYASISAGLLNDYVKTCSSLSTIYKFDSSWEKKLFGLELDEQVFKSLVEVGKSSKDVLKKYYKLKAKVHNLGAVKPWDAALELFKNNKKYSIEEAQELVRNAIKPLGEDYQKHYDEVINKRCVDYCQYKGKASGGYNVSVLDRKNSLIFMSFNEDLSSVSTLAHESGHNVHHQYIYENNDISYRFQPVIVAEVASLTNECLLSNYLINNASKEEALNGLSNIIAVILSNFNGAIQEGNLELKFHKYVENGGSLTKEYLNELTKESILEFYPVKKLDSEYEMNAWITRSHYYDAFYLFSYAISISAALYVSGEIIKGNNEMLEKYMNFLKTGSSCSVYDTYKVLGIDLNDKKVYEYAIKCLDEYLDIFNRIYEEVK